MAGQIAGCKIDGELGGAPGERDAGAAVAVVMDHRFGIELLRAHDETRRPEGPQSRDAADHAVRGDVHAGEGRGAPAVATRFCRCAQAARPNVEAARKPRRVCAVIQ